MARVYRYEKVPRFYRLPMNEEYVNNFPYEDTQMSLSGKTKFLTTNFTVKKTI